MANHDNGSLYKEAAEVLLFAIPKSGQQKNVPKDDGYDTTSYILNEDFIEAIKSGQALKPSPQVSQNTTTNNSTTSNMINDIFKITDYTGMIPGSKPEISMTTKSQSQQHITNKNNINYNNSSSNQYSISNYTLNSNEQLNNQGSFRTTVTTSNNSQQYKSPNCTTIDLAKTPISSLWNTDVLLRNTAKERQKMDEAKSRSSKELAEKIKQSAVKKEYMKNNSNNSRQPYNSFPSMVPSNSNAKPFMQSASNNSFQSSYLGHVNSLIPKNKNNEQHEPTDYSKAKVIKIESRHDYKTSGSSSSTSSGSKTKSSMANLHDILHKTIQQNLISNQDHLKANLKHKMNPPDYSQNLEDLIPNYTQQKIVKKETGQNLKLDTIPSFSKQKNVKKETAQNFKLDAIPNFSQQKIVKMEEDQNLSFDNNLPNFSQTKIVKIEDIPNCNLEDILPSFSHAKIFKMEDQPLNSKIQNLVDSKIGAALVSTMNPINLATPIKNELQQSQFQVPPNNGILQTQSTLISGIIPSSAGLPVNLQLTNTLTLPDSQIIDIKKDQRKYIKREARDPYFQDLPCYEISTKLPRCRDCRLPPAQRTKDAPHTCCRFYAFRKLLVDKKGSVRVAGFADPVKDAKPDDTKLWSADFQNVPKDLTVEKSKFLLSQVAYKFCEIYHQEKEAYYEHLAEDKTVAWKQPVKGVRELCDVCETTLFNHHWVCKTCGFVVCLDCYKGRKYEMHKGENPKHDRRDEYNWLLCNHRVPHEQNKLMITQIIPGDCLYRLVRQVHGLCALLEIPLNCECPFSKELQFRQLKNKFEFFYHKMVPEKEPMKVLVSIKSITSDVKEDEITCHVTYTSNIVEEKVDQNLKKKSYRFDGFQQDILVENNTNKDVVEENKAIDKNKIDGTTLNAILKQLLKNDQREILMFLTSLDQNPDDPSPNLDDVSNDIVINDEKVRQFLKFFFDSFILGNEKMPKENLNDKDFVLEYMKKIKTCSTFLNKGERIMCLEDSQQSYPNSPHDWLCNGKLLRLLEPLNDNNYRLFHDQWERGQPVIVSKVSDHLDKELWKPSSFIKDFGEKPNDLINCLNGKLIKNQLMKHFWSGFEREEFRLLDDRDNPMILKLKDWPPGDDFAEMLPTRFSDLMKVLPLKEYTLREGRLNLASRLPEFFVRPDLGPKMYNAYGGAFHLKKATTNLHLDISDAANVMVYVTAPRDSHFNHYMKQVWESIQHEIDDEKTVKRIRTNRELPGALWHIYHPSTTDSIREFLKEIEVERRGIVKADHDPIHDQKWYLDDNLRDRLKKERNIVGYTIVQCVGDAVFIPAGAPHQVRNILNCIKVAEDFVSPENIYYCCKLTNEFRYLTRTHSNHEDKLQIKNIIYHTVKDAVTCIVAPILSVLSIE